MIEEILKERRIESKNRKSKPKRVGGNNFSKTSRLYTSVEVKLSPTS